MGEPVVNHEGMQSYFRYKNETTGRDKPPINWQPTTECSAELLTEFYGRICYESWDADSTSNKNISRIRKDSTTYLQNIISSGHGSVMEHSMINFVIADVSRVFTHELVTHRVGIAKSQQSLRYYRGSEYGMGCIKEQIVGPSAILTMEEDLSDEVLKIVFETVEGVESGVKKLTDLLELDNGKMNFEVKKKLTSFIRRLSPDGQATDIGWSANLRTLRHVLELRTSRHAEWEMRLVFSQVGEMIINKYPAIFKDFNYELIDGIYEFSTLNSKV